MEISINNNTLSGESVFYTDNIGQYIVKIIDLYSATSVAQDNWLTNREKQFFVAMIIIHNSGISDHKSSEAKKIYDDIFGKQRKSVIGDYIRRLVGKDWIREVGGDIEITPLFDNLDIYNHKSTFTITFRLEDDNRQDLEEDAH